MPVLIDSSVWIEYFRHGSNADKVEMLLEEDLEAGGQVSTLDRRCEKGRKNDGWLRLSRVEI